MYCIVSGLKLARKAKYVDSNGSAISVKEDLEPEVLVAKTYVSLEQDFQSSEFKHDTQQKESSSKGKKLLSRYSQTG